MISSPTVRVQFGEDVAGSYGLLRANVWHTLPQSAVDNLIASGVRVLAVKPFVDRQRDDRKQRGSPPIVTKS